MDFLFLTIKKNNDMKDIIERLSNDIAKEIITRPNFDLEEVSGIIKFRLKESLLDILLSNVEKEEVIYHRLLLEQSNNRVGHPKYVELGYKLAIAKNKKAIANRAVNNVRQETKFKVAISYLKEKYGDEEMRIVHDLINEKGL